MPLLIHYNYNLKIIISSKKVSTIAAKLLFIYILYDVLIHEKLHLIAMV